MGWRGRLRELVRAGGAVAVAVTASGCGCVPLCNANPDPCCSAPESQQCAEWKACAASDMDVFACYEHWDLSSPAPDLAVPGDLAEPADLAGADDGGAAD